MDTILKGLADVLLVGGTVGAYAMISVVLIIVGYFKYLKPYLSEFYDLRGSIKEFKLSHSSQNEELEQIKIDIGKVVKLIDQKSDAIMQEVSTEHKELHVDLKNLMTLIEKELLVVLDKTERIQAKDEESQRELMIEITKLQTRLEFMSPSGLGGIRK